MSKKAYIGAPANSIKNIDIIENNINNYFYCETPWGDGETAFGSGGGFYWNGDQLCNEEQLAYDIYPFMRWYALTDIIELSFQCNDAAALSVYHNDTFISSTYNSTVTLTLLKNDIILFRYDDPTNTYSPQDEVCISNIKITIKNEIEESVAHHIPNIYIGVPTEVPIYDENSGNVFITSENIETYFDVTFDGENNTFQWIDDALVSDFENPVEPSTYSDVSTFMVIPRSILSLVAKSQIQFSFDVNFNNELSTLIALDELTITVNDTETTAIDSNQSLSYTLNQGDSIVICHYYANDVSYVSLSNLSILGDKEIVDTYIESRARKIIKAYIGVNNVAQQWYGDIECEIPFTNNFVVYTGNNITPVWNNYDSSKMDMRGDISGIDIGIYTTIFTLKQGYAWSDRTTDPKYITWKIVLPLQDLLIDFNYTEDNGIATITGWKGTYQGVASAEIIVPDDSRIIL